MSEKRFLTTREAAEAYRLSPATLNSMRNRGGGPPFIKTGRKVLYDRLDIDAWIAANKHNSTKE